MPAASLLKLSSSNILPCSSLIEALQIFFPTSIPILFTTHPSPSWLAGGIHPYAFRRHLESRSGFSLVTASPSTRGRDTPGLANTQPETCHGEEIFISSKPCSIWRSCYNIRVYPMSGYPAALHRAVEQGACSRLDAGKMLECEVSCVAYTGVSQVSRIDSNGKVS